MNANTQEPELAIDITEEVEVLDVCLSEAIKALDKKYGDAWEIGNLALMVYALGYRRVAEPMEVVDDNVRPI